MQKTFARLVEEANEALIVNGKIDDVGEYFASDYALHITGRVINGGHKTVRVRFFEGRIVEEWVVTDRAEQLLLSRKRGA